MTPGTSRERAEQDLRAFALQQVRSGLRRPTAQYDEVVAAIRAEMPDLDAPVLARAWLLAAAKQHGAEAATWPEVTDYARLQAAFEECRGHDVIILQGAEGEAAVEQAVACLEVRPRAVWWFSAPDVWHALDHGVLRIAPWRPDGTALPESDPLLGSVLACLERHGLRVRFLEGRLEVATRWQRRP